MALSLYQKCGFITAFTAGIYDYVKKDSLLKEYKFICCLKDEPLCYSTTLPGITQTSRNGNVFFTCRGANFAHAASVAAVTSFLWPVWPAWLICVWHDHMLSKKMESVASLSANSKNDERMPILV